MPVLDYADHDYLYFCAKDDLSGAHNFAKTLSEHNRNAAAYVRALNQAENQIDRLAGSVFRGGANGIADCSGPCPATSPRRCRADRGR